MIATRSPVWKKNPLPAVNHYINSVAITSGGTKVIGGTYYYPYSATGNHRQVVLQQMTVGTFAWDASGTLLWQHQFQAVEGVYWVAVSRDGSTAASCGLVSLNTGFIYAYDGNTGANQLLASPLGRMNMVALNGDGTVLAAAGPDAIHLFVRSGATWTALPQITVAANDSVIAVAVSDDGKSVVAGTYLGTVYLVPIVGTTAGTPTTWTLAAGSIKWVSMAAGGSSFAAAATGTTVYSFDTATFPTTKQPAWHVTLADCKGSCRAVAVSDDGTYVSVVAAAATGSGGKLHLLSHGVSKWSHGLTHSPNSTSIDATGKYVTAADGYPDGTPGRFYLYNTAGHALWHADTADMSWPMQVDPTGKAVAAGSDDGNVYYFSVV